jgi:ribosome-binding factor A
MTRRTDRVNTLLREEIASLLQRELRDPRLAGVVSITRVDVSPDLRHADAYVSVLGSDVESHSTMQALESARGFVRRELRRRLTMKSTPEVRFIEDRTIAEAQRITDLLRKTAEDRGEKL